MPSLCEGMSRSRETVVSEVDGIDGIMGEFSLVYLKETNKQKKISYFSCSRFSKSNAVEPSTFRFCLSYVKCSEIK